MVENRVDDDVLVSGVGVVSGILLDDEHPAITRTRMIIMAAVTFFIVLLFEWMRKYLQKSFHDYLQHVV
jgi:hypothetical protein